MKGGFLQRVRRGNDENYNLLQLNRDIVRLLCSYIKPYRKNLMLAFIIMLFVMGTNTVGPLLLKIAVDQYIVPGKFKGLPFISVLIILNYALFWFASYKQGYISAKVGQGVIKDIRKDLYNRVIHLPMDFFAREKTGQVLSRITHDTESLSQLVSFGIINLFSDVFTLIGMLAVMFYLDPGLTILIIILIPVVIVVFGILGGKIKRAYHEVRAKLAKLNEGVEENISGIRTVQAYSREKENVGRFIRSSKENLKANLKAVSIFALFFPAIDLSGVVGTGLVLWVGGTRVANGEISLGVLAAFLGYITSFFMPLRDLSQVYNTYQSGAASLERINEYLSLKTVASSHNKFIRLSHCKKPEIEFQNVYFGYKKKYILSDINLKVNPEEVLAIVGPSGAGKTTLARLVTGLYTQQKGKIKICGVENEKLALEDLRRLVLMVPQNVYLFPGSIADNIAFGVDNASRDDIISAAKSVMAHNLISGLPQGYDTNVGESGVKLSGGQKQLISFARAMLLDPEILILDEAVSSVDACTEAAILRAMDNLFKNRTVIMISHRFSTLKKADRIAVLDGGKIQAVGTHEELLNSCSLYRSLYLKQKN